MLLHAFASWAPSYRPSISISWSSPAAQKMAQKNQHISNTQQRRASELAYACILIMVHGARVRIEPGKTRKGACVCACVRALPTDVTSDVWTAVRYYDELFVCGIHSSSKLQKTVTIRDRWSAGHANWRTEKMRPSRHPIHPAARRQSVLLAPHESIRLLGGASFRPSRTGKGLSCPQSEASDGHLFVRKLCKQVKREPEKNWLPQRRSVKSKHMIRGNECKVNLLKNLGVVPASPLARDPPDDRPAGLLKCEGRPWWNRRGILRRGSSKGFSHDIMLPRLLPSRGPS